MDTSVDVLGAAEASARTTSHLHSLITSWRSAPEQLHHLRDDIERLANLLDTVQHSQVTARLLADPSDACLIREIALARRALESVEEILADFLSGEDVIHDTSVTVEQSRDSNAKRRHRWIVRREEIARSQRGLQLSCQHILSILVTRSL